MKIWGSFRVWLVAVVVVMATVVYLTPQAHPTAARIAHLESIIKCPSCDDLSVAQSTSESSLAVRHEIVTLVGTGESDATIIATLEQSYGPSILLSPAATGWGRLLWWLPLGLVIVVAGVGVVLWRRRS